MNFLYHTDKNFAFHTKANFNVDFLEGYYNKNKKYMEAKIRDTKQKIVAVIIILFMFMMVATSLEIKQAIAVNNQTNMFQNITAGTLTIAAAPDVTFSAATAGSTDTTTANLLVVNIRDYRGNANGWTSSAISSNFVNGAGGTVIIPNSRLQVVCGDQFAYNGASNTGVTKCSYTGNFGDGPRNIMIATTGNGAGAYNLFNSTLNLSILATDAALNYNATMTYTIS